MSPFLLACVLLQTFGAGAVQTQPKTRATPSLPVILIYWERGYSMEPPPNEVQFALWGDGRVIWRDPLRDWINIGGKWQWTPGKIFEGRVAPDAVAHAIGNFRQLEAFGLPDWNLVPVDASSYQVIVRDHGRKTVLTSWRNPPKGWDTGADRDLARSQLAVWNLAFELARTLRPSERREIRPPDASKWGKAS